VGCSMARGWRQAIQKHLGGVESCTHLRELLFNLATATGKAVVCINLFQFKLEFSVFIDLGA